MYGIKTDCLLVSEDKTTLGIFINFDNNIGGVKFEAGKLPIKRRISMSNNDLKWV